MMLYLWVALGSALGGVGRFGVGLLAARMWGERFPWGTIGINVLGSFVIGFFGTLTGPGGALPANPGLRVFVMVGICGGFTTFSSFSLQTLGLARDGNWFGAAGNVVLSVVLCLLSVTVGHIAADRIGIAQAVTLAPSATPPGVLALLDEPRAARPVLAAAAFAARGLGGVPIEVLHLRHEGLRGFLPTEEVMTGQREQEIEGAAGRKSDAMRDAFTSWRRLSGMGEWREIVGDTGRIVADEAARAALVVIGHDSGPPRGDVRTAIQAAVFMARRATLLVPLTEPDSLGRRIAVAWKPGAAAARAVDAAMPLLVRADQVTVLIVTQGARVADAGPLPRRLRQAGVTATVHRVEAGGAGIGAALIAEAHRVDADLLVMGARGRGRTAHHGLAGATREVLALADLPVLLRH